MALRWLARPSALRRSGCLLHSILDRRRLRSVIFVGGAREMLEILPCLVGTVEGRFAPAAHDHVADGRRPLSLLPGLLDLPKLDAAERTQPPPQRHRRAGALGSCRLYRWRKRTFRGLAFRPFPHVATTDARDSYSCLERFWGLGSAALESERSSHASMASRPAPERISRLSPGTAGVSAYPPSADGPVDSSRC